MPGLSQAKTLGGVGSILVLLTAVPTVGGLLGIVGFILMLVAIKNISDVVNDKAIFSDMLIAIGLAIVAVVVGALVVIGSVLRFIGLNNLNLGPNFNASSVPTGDWVGLIGSVLVGLAVVWVVMMISAVYVRRTYNEISSKLNIRMFETAGLVYLIGAALTIVLVGFVLLFVAQILVVVAFFSIEDREPMMTGQPQTQAPTG